MNKRKSLPWPMKLFSIFGLIVLLSSSFSGSSASVAYAQDPTPPTPNGDVQPLAADGTSLYYYVDGQRVNLTPSLDWVSVKFVSADTVEQQSVTGKFSSTVAPLDGAREIPHLGLTLLPLQDGLGTKTLVQGVNSMRASSTSFSQVNPVYSYDGVDMVVSDEFIAAFPPATSMADIDALNVARGVEVVSPILGQENTFVLRVTSAASLDALGMANHYQESGIALFAAPNFVRIAPAGVEATAEASVGPMAPPDPPTDSYYAADQWYLNNTGQYGPTTGDPDIDAPEAWNITQGDNSIIIAVIDEGVDLTHEDLVTNLVTGYDATGLGSNGAPASGSDDAHGTAVAGIAAAVSDNNQGVSGVCQLCRIMPIRIAYNVSNNWVYTDAWAANGIAWAVDPLHSGGADILNNSWGGGLGATVVNTAITNAVTNGRGGTGSVVVAAAGNDNVNNVSWPASLSNVISVGALNLCDQRKNPLDGICGDGINWGSNYGTALDVMAAGVYLTTTDIMGEYGYSYTADPNYDPAYGLDYTGYMNGTSGATPIVSGVVGLMLSVNPYMTPAHVQEILQKTTDNIGAAGWDEETGYGRVNAFNAVTRAKMADLVITGYELTEDAAGLVPIASNRPDPDQTFYVKIFIKNRGGTVAPPFYRSVYFQSRFTPLLVSLPGHEEDPPETYYEAGCLYSSNPQEPDLGDYHPDNLFPGIPAGSSDDGLTVEVTNGLADGAYTLWLYADAACNVVEGVEDKDNNDFGPITLNVGAANGCAAPMTGTPIFGDVPVGHWAREYVEALYTCGYTAGCSSSPLLYCPSNGMTRVESSVFILRGNFGASYVPPSSGASFGDNWSQGPWGQKWAQGLLNAGLTAGCSSSPFLFCPFDPTPRVQLAVFGVRLRHGSSFVPPAATGTVFADMTDPNYFGTKWAEQAYADGIIPACGTSGGKPMFCPNTLVDRALAAYTVVKAKYLLP